MILAGLCCPDILPDLFWWVIICALWPPPQNQWIYFSKTIWKLTLLCTMFKNRVGTVLEMVAWHHSMSSSIFTNDKLIFYATVRKHLIQASKLHLMPNSLIQHPGTHRSLQGGHGPAQVPGVLVTGGEPAGLLHTLAVLCVKGKKKSMGALYTNCTSWSKRLKKTCVCVGMDGSSC